MNELQRGTTPVEDPVKDPVDDEEEQGSKIKPNPEPIKKIPARPEDQEDLDNWKGPGGGKR